MLKSILANMVFLFLLYNIFSEYGYCNKTLSDFSELLFTNDKVESLDAQYDEDLPYNNINSNYQTTTSKNADDSKYGIIKIVVKLTVTAKLYSDFSSQSNITFLRSLLLTNKSPPVLT